MKLAVFYFICFFASYCQVSATPPDSTSRWLGITLYPTFGFSPETRWRLGAATLLTRQLYSDTLTRTSALKVEVNYTTNRQLILSSAWNIFTRADKYYFTGELAYLKFPEFFFGIGNDTPEQQKEFYDSRRIEFSTSLMRSIWHNWYIGPRYQLQYMYDVAPTPGGILAARLVPGATGGLSSGMGVALAYGSRRNILNPQQGFYAAASITTFHAAIGSDFEFTRFHLDLRKYIRLPWQHLLALQTLNIFNTGFPPFRMLALLGNDAVMRGYYQGRYRERQFMSFQAEYRLPLFWRFGATAFAGAGDVAYKLRQFQILKFKPSYGLGLRFKINQKENINLRLDYARGHNTSGFYLSIGEAF